jgi:hypothetical protein
VIGRSNSRVCLGTFVLLVWCWFSEFRHSDPEIFDSEVTFRNSRGLGEVFVLKIIFPLKNKLQKLTNQPSYFRKSN